MKWTIGARWLTLTTRPLVLMLATLSGNQANGQLLSSSDTAIAIDLDATFVGTGWVGSSFPNDERPAQGIDQVINDLGQHITKYFNYGIERSGMIITNSEGPVDVNFMQIWTANTSPERDPASYALYGTNDPITSVENSNSNGTEVWTLLSSGPLSLSDERYMLSEYIRIWSPANYSSYRLIFPTVKNAAAANSMQIADIQFYTAINIGDYNRNNVVDAADYVVWRNTDRTFDGYNLWRVHFGRTLESFDPSGATIPEPSAALLLTLGAAIACCRMMRRDSKRTEV